MKILLAEADAASRQALEGTLANWGYEVVAATDGDAGWAALQGSDPAKLAILASALPGLGALEVCRKARERTTPYLYILLLTSGERREDVVAGLEAGVDDFLTQPFDTYDLKARLRAGRRILDLQDALRDAQQAFHFEAKHDPLTAAWNRAAILDLLRHELARGIRERTPVGVVMVDVDGFKSINETHGDSAGDAVLRETVRRIGSLVRSYDGIGRYGTNEFLIVLPGCDTPKAHVMAGRIRECVIAHEVQLPEALIPVTISLGAAAGGGGTTIGPEALVAVANAALSRAIEAGGNRVELGTEEG